MTTLATLILGNQDFYRARILLRDRSRFESVRACLLRARKAVSPTRRDASAEAIVIVPPDRMQSANEEITRTLFDGDGITRRPCRTLELDRREHESELVGCLGREFRPIEILDPALADEFLVNREREIRVFAG